MTGQMLRMHYTGTHDLDFSQVISDEKNLAWSIFNYDSGQNKTTVTTVVANMDDPQPRNSNVNTQELKGHYLLVKSARGCAIGIDFTQNLMKTFKLNLTKNDVIISSDLSSLIKESGAIPSIATLEDQWTLSEGCERFSFQDKYFNTVAGTESQVQVPSGYTMVHMDKNNRESFTMARSDISDEFLKNDWT